MNYIPFEIAGWLFLIGLYGIVTSRNLIHLTICLSVAQSATYILLLSIGYRRGAAAPIFFDKPVGTPSVDPVVQALALTDIVVGAAVTALILVIIIQLYRLHSTIDPQKLISLRG